MLARYAMLSALIMAVAVATGFGVYKIARSSDYVASCSFQLALPSTSTLPSSDILVFNRRQASNEIANVQVGDLAQTVARQTGIPASVAGSQSLVPTSDNAFSIYAAQSRPADAVRLANALCQGYVQQLRKNVHAQQSAEVQGLRNRLNALERQLATVPKGTTGTVGASNLVQRAALAAAIDRNKQVLTVTLSIPPDNISIVSLASGAGLRNKGPSLSKSLIVGAAAGLLLSFLAILAIEGLRARELERRVGGGALGSAPAASQIERQAGGGASAGAVATTALQRTQPGDTAARSPSGEGFWSRRGALAVLLVLVAGLAASTVVLAVDGNNGGHGSQSTVSAPRASRPVRIQPLRTPLVVDNARFAVFFNPQRPGAVPQKSPGAGRRWAVVELRVRNLGRSGFDPSRLPVTLTDAGGHSYQPEPTFGMAADASRSGTKPLATNAGATLMLAYAVPKTASGLLFSFPAGPGVAAVVALR